MRVLRLGHVNIRTPVLAETIAFYERCLGLRSGPAASARGRRENVWLYDAADVPLIHVNGIAPDEMVPPAGTSGRLDHFAIDCEGLDRCIAWLDAEGVPYERLRIEARGLTQLNVRDPNGLKVELTFSDAAVPTDTGRSEDAIAPS